MDNGDMAEQILTAATAFAGLLLVFIGNVVAGYEGYHAEAQSDVRAKYQRRGWFAFVAFALALTAALLALLTNWFSIPGLTFTAVGLLILSFIAVVILAFSEVRGID